jgi:hypothetical protein
MFCPFTENRISHRAWVSIWTMEEFLASQKLYFRMESTIAISGERRMPFQSVRPVIFAEFCRFRFAGNELGG